LAASGSITDAIETATIPRYRFARAWVGDGRTERARLVYA
jgi:hypothetical protein